MTWDASIRSTVVLACLLLAGMNRMDWRKQRPLWGRLAFGLIAAMGCLAAIEAHAAQLTYRSDSDYLIDTWEAEDDWPGGSVNTMAQTPEGYLWLGTQKGLVRFDGVKFSVFGNSSIPELPYFARASIVKLHLDRAGILWAGTTKGVAVRSRTEWLRVPLPEADNNRGNHFVRSLAERANGGILLTTYDGGVLEFRNGQFSALPAPPGRTNSGYLGLVDANGAWWVVQHRFIGKWDGQRWSETVSLADLPNLAPGQVGGTAGRAGGVWLMLGSELRHYRGGQATRRVALAGLGGDILDLLEDSRGNVWICTGGAGLWQVSVNDQVRQWSPTNGLADNLINFAFEDREKNVWIGSRRGGLTRFKERTFQNYLTVTNRLAFARYAVAASPTGGVFIASWRRGLWQADAASLAKIALPKPFNDAFVSALSLLVDRTGCLWIGAMTNGVWRIEGQDARWMPIDESGRSPVHALFEDSRGRIWLAGDQSVAMFEAGAIQGAEPARGLPAGRVSAFAEDRSGALWLTHARGVFRLATNRWVEVLAAEGRSLHANSLFAEADGGMWLALANTGLARWREGRLRERLLPPELPMRGLHTIQQDRQGFLWMTSPQGLLRARKDELKSWLDGQRPAVTWQVLDASDGLPTAECESSVQDDQGRLWFATTRGVSRVDPARERPPSAPPAVQIEELTYHRAAPHVYGGEAVGSSPPPVRSRLEWPFPPKLTLPPGSRRLEVHYTALDFAAPEKLRFQTRLDPGDSDWQDFGDRRIAYYYDFNPGSYVFRVRAVNHAGLWNETGASLAFTVQPHFWQTLWFKAVVLAVLTAVAYGGFRRRVSRLEKQRAAQHAFTRQIILSQENERKRVAAELHDGLGQDLLLVKNRLALAAARQADAAELTRQLEAAAVATTRAITEARAISHALRPAALEQVGLTKAIEWMVEQLGEGSTTKFSTETENIDGLLAPEMEMNLFRVIQEGLNNVSRHAAATQVILEVKREAAGLRVSLFDNGRGFDTEKVGHPSASRPGLGLASIAERVNYLGGSLDLQSTPGRGTRVTVRIPLPQTKA